MKPLNERIKVEIDNIEIVIKELKVASIKVKKTNLEISGIGALLHNFYSGIENILKQIFIEYKLIIPEDSPLHKELLSEAGKNKIISYEVKGKLEKYLTFRHFLYIYILLC